jgi:hypothetical protein
MSALADLFPDGDFRFHLTLRRSAPAAFFSRRDATGRLLAERARWLRETPERYAALTEEGRAVLAEWAGMSRAWGATERATVAELGAQLEPDFLLLTADERGAFRLRGGALCFPTGWALEEKMGQTLDEIHGVVPGLNAALASPIQQFLTRLRPGGGVVERDNWGLATTDELNLHPARALSAPELPVTPEKLWLRIERQAFLALPRTAGIVFGIRIELHRMDQVAQDRAAAVGLRRALETMPGVILAYKRLTGVRNQVVSWL